MARASIATFLLIALVDAAEKQKVGVVVGHDASLSFTEGAPRKSSSLVRRAERRTEERQPDDIVRDEPRQEEREPWRPLSGEGEERSSVDNPYGSIDDIFNDPIFKNHGRREPYDMDYDPRDGDYEDEASYRGRGYGHRRGKDEYSDNEHERRQRGEDEFGDTGYERHRHGRESDYERERDRERNRARDNPYDDFGDEYLPKRTGGAYRVGPHSEDEAVQEAEKVESIIEHAEKRAGLPISKLAPKMPTMNADLADKEEFSLAWLGCIFVVAAGGFMLGWRMRTPEKPKAATAERSEGQRDDEGEQSSLAAPHAAGDSR